MGKKSAIYGALFKKSAVDGALFGLALISTSCEQLRNLQGWSQICDMTICRHDGKLLQIGEVL